MSDKIIQEITEELRRAREKFPRFPTEILHAVAIVNEESGELTQACLQSVYGGKTHIEVRKEAIQTAAMAIRFLENLDYMFGYPSNQREDK